MKKTKLLLGAINLIVIAPCMSLTTVSCGKTQPTEKHVVVLYAGGGKFTEDRTQIFLKDVPKGTLLKNIPGYAEPTQEGDLSFAYWVDNVGNKVTSDTIINNDLILGAKFTEPVRTPVSFKDDNWATLCSQCTNAQNFAKTYFSKDTSSEEEAIDFLNTEIKKPNPADVECVEFPHKEIHVSYNTVDTTVRVRLIGVGVDKAFDGSAKTLFTFEFVDQISSSAFSGFGNNNWYESDGSSCLLRSFCNQFLINYLPVSVVDKIVEVKKTTLTPDNKSTIDSPELLFPLSFEEYGCEPALKKVCYYDKTDSAYPFYQQYTSTDKWQDLTTSKKNTKFYLGYDGRYKGKGEVETETYQVFLPYWLRNPRTTNYGNKVYMFNPDNGKAQVEYTNTSWGVAPAFCI